MRHAAADEGTPASSAAANGEAGGAGGDEGLDGEQPHHKVSKAAKRRVCRRAKPGAVRVRRPCVCGWGGWASVAMLGSFPNGTQ
jgi:hypothetical protein